MFLSKLEESIRNWPKLGVFAQRAAIVSNDKYSILNQSAVNWKIDEISNQNRQLRKYPMRIVKSYVVVRDKCPIKITLCEWEIFHFIEMKTSRTIKALLEEEDLGSGRTRTRNFATFVKIGWNSGNRKVWAAILNWWKNRGKLPMGEGKIERHKDNWSLIKAEGETET